MGSDARAEPDSLMDSDATAGTGRGVGAKVRHSLASLASRVADLRGATRESEVRTRVSQNAHARCRCARRIGARSGGASEVDARGLMRQIKVSVPADELGVQRPVDPPRCRRGTGALASTTSSCQAARHILICR